MTVVLHPPLMSRIRRGHWLTADCVAAVGYGLLLVPLLTKYADRPAAVLCALAAFTLPIALRRRRLMAALGLLVAGLAVTLVVEPRAYLAAIVPMTCVVYLAATGPRRIAFGVLGVSLAGAAAAALPDFAHLGATVVSGLCYLTGWTVGYAVGMHRRYTAELLRHQARLADAALEQGRHEMTQERLRIARELHDIISHSLSVITVQAAFGALVVDHQPEEARSALDAIESTGRQTLTELRALLGVLRAVDDSSGTEKLTPAPSLSDLGRLISHTEQAGVRVYFVSSHRRAMPAGIELTAYRIVQEALTNVVRHAGTPSASVLIQQSDVELVIEVADEGGGASTSGGGAPGQGLVGMRERVQAYGGTVQAASLTHGGFRVRAVIPLPADAALPQAST